MQMNDGISNNKITDWVKEPTFDDLNQDLVNAQPAHDIYLTKLAEYRRNLGGGPEVRARTGKSTYRPLVIRKSLEWKVPALVEPFMALPTMFRLKPRTPKDVPGAKQQELYLNYLWSVKLDKAQLLDEVMRTFAAEGTVIVKNGWHVEEEEVEVPAEVPLYATVEQSIELMRLGVESGELSIEEAKELIDSGRKIEIGTTMGTKLITRLVQNHCTHEVRDNADVIVDPTCEGNIQKAKFVIDKYQLDLSTLTKDKYREFEDGSSKGIYHNLDKIDFKADNEEYDEHDSESRRSFVFADKARKKVQVYEYWGEWDIDGNDMTTPIVATWIGDTLVRLQRNPFIHQQLPFSSAVVMPVKGQFHGEPDGALFAENQKQIGILNRAALDITTTQAIGQRLVNEQMFTSPSQWDAFNKGNDARFRADMNPATAIYKQNVEPVNGSLFQMLSLNTNEVESLTGTKAFAQGLTGDALGSTATGVRSTMDATAKREMNILRRISSQLFQSMGRQDLANATVFASPEEVVNVTDTEFVTITKESMRGEVDLMIEISTPERDNATAEKLEFMAQTTTDDGIRNEMLAESMRLRGLVEFADKIKNYTPPPNPQEEEMRAIQLENAKLENSKLQAELQVINKQLEEADSRIYERLSRTEENTKGDTVKKQAEANLANAQAGKLEAETDILDTQFVEGQNGIKRQRDVDDLVYKEEMRAKVKSDTDLTSLKTEELRQMYAKLNDTQGEV